MRASQRVARGIKRYGALGLVVRAVRTSTPRYSRDVYRRLFLNRHYYYRYDRSSAVAAAPAGLVVERFDQADRIPDELMANLLHPDAERGEQFITVLEREFREHASLWLATCDDALVCSPWTWAGRYMPSWYLPLADDDLVLFGAIVPPMFRGMRMCPAVRARVGEYAGARGARAYCDVVQWNVSSIRAVLRAGFVQVGIGPRLPHYGEA